MILQVYIKVLILILSCLISCSYTIYDVIEEHRRELNRAIAIKSDSIPMISVSMNINKNNYLGRLLASIDFAVDVICIQIGNADSKIVRNIIEEIQLQRLRMPHLNIQVSTLDYNPGSAKGFNFGLRNMIYSPHKPHWVLIVNNDIAFYPGLLQRLNHMVHSQLVSNDKFGIGFTSLCCGGEWSAVVFTRRLVENIGFFDENFYPAYYEDDDYGIRVSLSPYKAVRFDNTSMLHGMIDGSKDYLSGLFTNLYLTKSLSRGEIAWKNAQEEGQVVSKAYIEKKWNIKMPGFKDKIKAVDCKTVDGINSKCIVGFSHPYGDSTKSLSYWIVDEQQFNRLKTIANTI